MPYGAEVQYVGKHWSGSNTTQNFASLPTVGNIVFVGVTSWDGTATTSHAVSDNQGNVYRLLVGVNANSNTRMDIFYAVVEHSAGTFTITVDPLPNAAAFAAFHMWERPGGPFNPSRCLDGSSADTTILGPAIAGTAWNSVAGDDLGVLGVTSAGTSLDPTYTAGTGWAITHELTDNTNFQEMSLAERTITAAGSYQALMTGSLTLVGPNTYAIIGAALRAAPFGIITPDYSMFRKRAPSR